MSILPRTTIGVFSSRKEAEEAIEELARAGYSPKEMSVLTREMEEVGSLGGNVSDNVAGGIASGLATGGALGGVAGILMGAGALTIPGIGPLLIGGPIAATLGLTGAAATATSAAITGALAGGMVGGLVGLGVPEEAARVYEKRLSEGAVLLAVPTTGTGNDDDVRAVLEMRGADQIRTIG